MRILHLIDHLGLGGAQLGLVRLLELARGGVHNSVVALGERALPEMLDRLQAAGVEARVLALGKRNPLGLCQLRREIAGDDVDILHTHLDYSNSLGVLAAASLGRNRPQIIRTFHNIPSRQYPLSLLALSRLATRWVAADIAVSSDVAASLPRRPRPLGVAIVPPIAVTGSDPTHPDPDLVRRLRGGAGPVVGTVGRLVAQKNQRALLAALPLILESEPSARLLVVGDGPLRMDLEEEAERLGLADAVAFCGYQRDRASFFAAMDLLAMPSRHEGIGLAFLEAMAYGVPIVATRVPGTTAAIIDGLTGLLVPEDDPRALATGILAVLHEPELRQRLIAGGREHLQREVRIDAQIQATIELYRKVVSAARR